MIELSEVAGPKGKLFRLIREASQGLGRPRSGAPVPRPRDAVMRSRTPIASRPTTCSRRRSTRARSPTCSPASRAAAPSCAWRARPTTCARAAAPSVDRVDELEPRRSARACRARGSSGSGIGGPYRRARVTVSFPLANIDANLPTLAATVAGNLYDLGEATGVRLEALRIPAAYRARFERPRVGVDGTRARCGVPAGPLVGTIIKPNVGLSAEATGALVARAVRGRRRLHQGRRGLRQSRRTRRSTQRVPAVMRAVRDWQQSERQARDGRLQHHRRARRDAAPRRARRARRRQLRDGEPQLVRLLVDPGAAPLAPTSRCTVIATASALFARHPALGMGFQPYQAMWRLAGVDHMHVHGLQGKFAQADDEVIESARDCLTPLADAGDRTDRVMPAFSSGQWAGTLPATLAVVPQRRPAVHGGRRHPRASGRARAPACRACARPGRRRATVARSPTPRATRRSCATRWRSSAR